MSKVEPMDRIKDIYRNPLFYYVLVPLLAALWPLFVRVAYLPNAERKWHQEKADYTQGQEVVQQILRLDPGRLELAASRTDAAQFDYAAAVDTIAGLCKIAPANYKLTSGPIIKSGGRKSQSAQVGLKDVDITRFSRFLSTILLSHPDLQCTDLKLTKKKGVPDAWEADLKFKYYF